MVAIRKKNKIKRLVVCQRGTAGVRGQEREPTERRMAMQTKKQKKIKKDLVLLGARTSGRPSSAVNPAALCHPLENQENTKNHERNPGVTSSVCPDGVPIYVTSVALNRSLKP